MSNHTGVMEKKNSQSRPLLPKKTRTCFVLSETARAYPAEETVRLLTTIRAYPGRFHTIEGPESYEIPEKRYFQRFSLVFRIQHILLFSSCILLIATGLPLKFPDLGISSSFFHILGGLQASRILHRAGAVVLIFVGCVHLFYLLFTRDGRKNFMGFLPSFKDVTDVMQNVFYMMGFTNRPPRFDRFSYIEKFDYWAVYWGMVVMIFSGLILWFANLSLALLPKYFLDIAHEAHSDEALLATLAIIIWHFYNVHFNPDRFPMSWTWLTGKISEEEMKKHHPIEYERILKEEHAASGEEPAGIASGEESRNIGDERIKQ